MRSLALQPGRTWEELECGGGGSGGGNENILHVGTYIHIAQSKQEGWAGRGSSELIRGRRALIKQTGGHTHRNARSEEGLNPRGSPDL
eukprot:4242984-Pyramimonas_sp.AAC.2